MIKGILKVSSLLATVVALSPAVYGATSSATSQTNTPFSLQLSVAGIKGLDNGTAAANSASAVATPSYVQKYANAWKATFGSYVGDLAKSTFDFTVTPTATGANTVTGSLSVGNLPVAIASVEPTGMTTVTTSAGTVKSMISPVSVKVGSQNFEGDLLLATNSTTNLNEACLTIDNSTIPLVVDFGTKFLTPSILGQMFPAPKTAVSSATPAAKYSGEVPTTASTPSGTNWNYVSHGSTDILAGANTGNPTCVVLGSDKQAGSLNDVEDQVWGGASTANWLNIDWGYDAWQSLTAVQFSVSTGSSSPADFVDPPNPSASGSSNLTEWTWVLSYVPYIGSELTALANYELSLASIQQTANGQHQMQMQWNNPSYQFLTSTSDPGSDTMSYDEEFLNSESEGSGYSVNVDGMITWEAEDSYGDVGTFSTPFVYAGGTL